MLFIIYFCQMVPHTKFTNLYNIFSTHKIHHVIYWFYTHKTAIHIMILLKTSIIYKWFFILKKLPNWMILHSETTSSYNDFTLTKPLVYVFTLETYRSHNDFTLNKTTSLYVFYTQKPPACIMILHSQNHQFVWFYTQTLPWFYSHKPPTCKIVVLSQASNLYVFTFIKPWICTLFHS